MVGNNQPRSDRPMKYEVVIWYDTAQKPGDRYDPDKPLGSYTHKETVETLKEAKQAIEKQIWQVDNHKENGTNLGDNRKEYGYWSKTKDRQTGKQWYEWATVEVRRIQPEKVNLEKVMNQSD